MNINIENSEWKIVQGAVMDKLKRIPHPQGEYWIDNRLVYRPISSYNFVKDKDIVIKVKEGEMIHEISNQEFVSSLKKQRLPEYVHDFPGKTQVSIHIMNVDGHKFSNIEYRGDFLIPSDIPIWGEGNNEREAIVDLNKRVTQPVNISVRKDKNSIYTYWSHVFIIPQIKYIGEMVEIGLEFDGWLYLGNSEKRGTVLIVGKVISHKLPCYDRQDYDTDGNLLPPASFRMGRKLEMIGYNLGEIGRNT